MPLHLVVYIGDSLNACLFVVVCFPLTDFSSFSVLDILLDLDAPVSASKAPATATADLWGDFSTASR